jgi:hypothetical protein
MFLFKFALALNSALLFWKLLVFEFLLGISENFLCSLHLSRNSASARCDSATIVVCRDVGVFGTEIVFLITFYSGSFFLLKYWLYSIWMYVYQFFSPHNGWRDCIYCICIIVWMTRVALSCLLSLFVCMCLSVSMFARDFRWWVSWGSSRCSSAPLSTCPYINIK